MFYDCNQFLTDLRSLVKFKGVTKPNGFYTVRVFEEGSVRIVDPFVKKPQMFVRGKLIDESNVPMDSFAAKFLLDKVVNLGDDHLVSPITEYHLWC